MYLINEYKNSIYFFINVKLVTLCIYPTYICNFHAAGPLKSLKNTKFQPINIESSFIVSIWSTAKTMFKALD